MSSSQDKDPSTTSTVDTEQRDVEAAAHALTITEAVHMAVDEWQAEAGLTDAEMHLMLDAADLDKLADEIALKLTMAGFGKR